MKKNLIVLGYTIGLALALSGYNANSPVGAGKDVQNDSAKEQLMLDDGSVVTFDSNIISQDTDMIYEIYTVKNFDENNISISDQYVFCDIPFAFTLDEEWCKTKFGNEVTNIIKNTERTGSRTVLYFKNGTEITKNEYDSFVKDYSLADEDSYKLIDGVWTGDITDETKAEFIDHFMGEGASKEKPFYVFYETDDSYQNTKGKLQLELYYDETTGNGCGIRYVRSKSDKDDTSVKMKGFAFTTTENITDNQNKNGFYTYDKDILSVTYYNGSNGSNAVENYEESYEYNDAGQMIHYESTGRINSLKDADENQTIIDVDFTYREDGTLSRKKANYNTYIFGTTQSSHVMYFDEQQRAIYDRAYITHGSLDFYYIYDGDAAMPDYVLMLDDNLGYCLPSFAKY